MERYGFLCENELIVCDYGMKFIVCVQFHYLSLSLSVCCALILTFLRFDQSIGAFIFLRHAVYGNS